mmetsp:Transcript_4222/g.6524  ORF Transcript_4222/g.6524 Transcript_4222/m.6524 type:complete len:423 (+) Transcript_4222:2303-3571(+)
MDVTVEFMRNTVGEADCVSVEVDDFSNQGGFTGDMFLLRTTHEQADGLVSKTRVIKTFVKGKLEKSIKLGLAREGLFLANVDQLEETVSVFIPKVTFSRGDMDTGEKLIIMEKLQGCQAGHLFTDKHHPSSWEVEDPRIANSFLGNISQLEVCEESFRLAARLHANSWMDKTMATKWPWLKGSQTVTGQADPQWKSSQDAFTQAWEKTQQLILDVQNKNGPFFNDMKFSSLEEKMAYKDITSVYFDPHLVKCIQVSLSKIDFSACQKRYIPGQPSFYPWSLAHGDFWPGNIFFAKSGDSYVTKLLDFEVIGLGSGAQELGQFMISNSSPEARRGCEYELCKIYHQELEKHLAESDKTYLPTVEQVWTEYKVGGASRWIWFVVYLAPIMPPYLTQYFCDQVTAILKDHFLGDQGAQLVDMPRV